MTPQPSLDLMRACAAMASRGDFQGAAQALDALDDLEAPPWHAPLTSSHPAREAGRGADALGASLCSLGQAGADLAWRFLESPWGGAALGPQGLGAGPRARAALALAGEEPQSLLRALALFESWRGADFFELDLAIQGPLIWPSGSPQALRVSRFLQSSLLAQASRLDPSGATDARALGAVIAANPDGSCLRELILENPALWAKAHAGARPPLASALALAWRLGWEPQAQALLGHPAALASLAMGGQEPYASACAQALDPLKACQALAQAGVALPALDPWAPHKDPLAMCAARGLQAGACAQWIREKRPTPDNASLWAALAHSVWNSWEPEAAQSLLGVEPAHLARWCQLQGASSWEGFETDQDGQHRLARLCAAASASKSPAVPAEFWRGLASQAAAWGSLPLFQAAIGAEAPSPALFLKALGDRRPPSPDWPQALGECLAWSCARGLDGGAEFVDFEGNPRPSLAQAATEALIGNPGGSAGSLRARAMLMGLAQAGFSPPPLEQCANGDWAKASEIALLNQARALAERVALAPCAADAASKPARSL